MLTSNVMLMVKASALKLFNDDGYEHFTFGDTNTKRGENDASASQAIRKSNSVFHETNSAMCTVHECLFNLRNPANLAGVHNLKLLLTCRTS